MFSKQIYIYCLVIACFVIGVASCSNSHENRTINEQNSFCYWKTQYTFDDLDASIWKQTGTEHMYMRYFDVGWDVYSKEAKPMATLSNSGDSLYAKHITPAIFFSNNVFLLSTQQQLDTLALRIKERIKAVDLVFEKQHFTDKYNEILIDCDWSVKSKDKFFYFIEKLKEEISDKQITVTLRLWQYKSPQLAGVPPVRRVLLMCYNVQAANEYDAENSIATLDEIKKYIHGVTYPLKIDVALPLFSWGVLFRNGEFKGVVRNARVEDYVSSDQYEQIGDNRFVLRDEMMIGDFFARFGDEIRVESLSSAQLAELSEYILSQVRTDQYSRVTLFSWDFNLKNRTTISRQQINEIKNIYSTIIR